MKIFLHLVKFSLLLNHCCSANKYLSLLGYLAESDDGFDERAILERIRSDQPENDDPNLIKWIAEWRILIHQTSHVPEWFHLLHVEKFPNLPTLGEILSAAYPDLPIMSPVRISVISRFWTAFCVAPVIRKRSGDPCVFEPLLLAHGYIQRGYRMRSETLAELIKLWRQREIEKEEVRMNAVPLLTEADWPFTPEAEDSMIKLFFSSGDHPIYS